MVSMGCVREVHGGTYFGGKYVASTNVSVAKQGYSSCPCRVSLISISWHVWVGYGRGSAAAKRWVNRVR